MVLDGIIGSAQDSLTDLTGQPGGSEGGSLDTLEEDDFDVFLESSLTAGQWETFAEYVVEPQTLYNVGYGKAEFPENQGTFYAHFEDGAGNVVTGQVRVRTDNANETNPDVEISGISTSRLDTNETDSRQQYKVGEIKDSPRVGEDSKIMLQFRLKSGSAGTNIDQAASRILLDTTRYD